jgi:hypothetical protein
MYDRRKISLVNGKLDYDDNIFTCVLLLLAMLLMPLVTSRVTAAIAAIDTTTLTYTRYIHECTLYTLRRHAHNASLHDTVQGREW